jgi:hypothetical protein
MPAALQDAEGACPGGASVGGGGGRGRREGQHEESGLRVEGRGEVRLKQGVSQSKQDWTKRRGNQFEALRGPKRRKE